GIIQSHGRSFPDSSRRLRRSFMDALHQRTNGMTKRSRRASEHPSTRLHIVIAGNRVRAAGFRRAAPDPYREAWTCERYSTTGSPRDIIVRSRVKPDLSRMRHDASFPTATRPTRDGNSSGDRAIAVRAETISRASPLPQSSRLNV